MAGRLTDDLQGVGVVAFWDELHATDIGFYSVDTENHYSGPQAIEGFEGSYVRNPSPNYGTIIRTVILPLLKSQKFIQDNFVWFNERARFQGFVGQASETIPQKVERRFDLPNGSFTFSELAGMLHSGTAEKRAIVRDLVCRSTDAELQPLKERVNCQMKKPPGRSKIYLGPGGVEFRSQRSLNRAWDTVQARRARLAMRLATDLKRKLFDRGFYNYDRLIDALPQDRPGWTPADYIKLIDEHHLWLTDPTREITPEEDAFVDYHKTGHIEPHVYRDMWNEPHIVNDLESEYPVLLATKQFGPHQVQFRQNGQPLKYVQHDADDNIVRDAEGLATYMPFDAMVAKGLPTHDTGIAAIVGNRVVGYAADEWGADGVWVDPEFQRLGIGTELIHRFRQQFQKDRRLGQMTFAGEMLARSYFRKHLK